MALWLESRTTSRMAHRECTLPGGWPSEKSHRREEDPLQENRPVNCPANATCCEALFAQKKRAVPCTALFFSVSYFLQALFTIKKHLPDLLCRSPWHLRAFNAL